MNRSRLFGLLVLAAGLSAVWHTVGTWWLLLLGHEVLVLGAIDARLLPSVAEFSADCWNMAAFGVAVAALIGVLSSMRFRGERAKATEEGLD